MKKKIIALVLLFVISFVGGCAVMDAKQADANQYMYNTERFIMVDKGSFGRAGFNIVKDTVTGVNYIYIHDWRNAYGMGSAITVLVDKDGKPLL